MDLNGSEVDLGWVWMDLEWIWGGSEVDLGSGLESGPSGPDPALFRNHASNPAVIRLRRLARRTPHWRHSGPFFYHH